MIEHRLRHVTASGGNLVNRWDLDKDGKLLVSIQVAYGPVVHLPLAVRSVRDRVRARGEFAIWCVSGSGEVWRVEYGVLDAWLDPPHPLLPAMSLLLTNAPPEVAERLFEIVR